jgi:hypothetical protein
LGEELVGSYLYQFHLHHRLQSYGYDSEWGLSKLREILAEDRSASIFPILWLQSNLMHLKIEVAVEEEVAVSA